MQNIKFITLIFLIFGCISTFAQRHDSLSQKPNRYLVAKLDSLQFDRNNPMLWIYLGAYIKNAKIKDDHKTLFYGYRTAIYHSEGKQKLAYADSALISAKKTKESDFIGNAYYLKGHAFYEEREYKKTLDNYLMANEILQSSNDKFAFNQVTYGIAVVKSYLGYYNDALQLIDSALKYFQNQKTPDGNLFYIRCLFRKGEIYQNMEDFKKAAEVNLIGLQESIKFKEKIQEQYFNLAIGVDEYYAGNFAHSIHSIEKALPTMRENNYFEMEAKGYFYMAKSYAALHQDEKALHNYQMVDSLFVKHNYLSQRLRGNYEWLIDYYKSKGNKDKQLYYINQLLKVDQVNATNNQYLVHKINKDYDTQRLIKEKAELEKEFDNWRYYAIGVLLFFLLVTLLYFYKFRKSQQNNQKLHLQYQELLRENQENTTFKKADIPVKKAVKEIPENIVEDILNRLEKFEQNHEFLNKNIDLKSMADKFKTNTTYLSKVVNTYKKRNFNSYLNKLRINYMIELLKKEPKFRNFTIEALSEIGGFTSSRHFSDTFFAETGLRPTYFLDKIQKEDKISL
jgi:AraC-like DNA-binding protein